MKENPEKVNLEEILFNFDTSSEQEEKQVEFLYSYYIAKLKMLRKENPYLYTTKEAAKREGLYKDLISASACYLHDLKFKTKNNEGNN